MTIFRLAERAETIWSLLKQQKCWPFATAAGCFGVGGALSWCVLPASRRFVANAVRAACQRVSSSTSNYLGKDRQIGTRRATAAEYSC